MHRGSDYLGKSGYKGTLNLQAQIKWRDDPEHRFTRRDLFTMIDEAEKANIQPQDLYLYVLSASTKDPLEILHWKDNFRDEWGRKMQIITGRIMSDTIQDKIRIEHETPIHAFTQFWIYFKESVMQV